MQDDQPPDSIWVQKDFSWFRTHKNGTYYSTPDGNSIQYVRACRLRDDEVQRRMDAVVEAAVNWHTGNIGWAEDADALEDAIDSLLELRGEKR